MSEVLNPHKVVTRKEHQCFGCCRFFPPKSIMQRSGVSDGGTVWTCYLCETCSDISRSMRYGDEFGMGDLNQEALRVEQQPAKIKEEQK